ncbi:DUF3846 domain-containing protein [Priestia aryabhattai]|uniref:DUF3846 domain-containing protein n=1 Tax=Priestia aryabhattai TaxID=412384 RepID=UPI002E1CF4A9|nr:DUF3846 domain-containing protein [Priestia aryabhattai]
MYQNLIYATAKPGEQVIFNEKKVSDTLSLLQDHVGGYVDCVHFEGIDIWCHDEGMLLGLEPSLIIKNDPSPRLTQRDIMLAGPIIMTSHDDEGETVSLNLKAIDTLLQIRQITYGSGKKVLIFFNY